MKPDDRFVMYIDDFHKFEMKVRQAEKELGIGVEHAIPMNMVSRYVLEK